MVPCRRLARPAIRPQAVLAAATCAIASLRLGPADRAAHSRSRARTHHGTYTGLGASLARTPWLTRAAFKRAASSVRCAGEPTRSATARDGWLKPVKARQSQ